MALKRLAPSRRAPTRLALLRSAPRRSALLRSARERSAPLRDMPRRAPCERSTAASGCLERQAFHVRTPCFSNSTCSSMAITGSESHIGIADLESDSLHGQPPSSGPDVQWHMIPIVIIKMVETYTVRLPGPIPINNSVIYSSPIRSETSGAPAPYRRLDGPDAWRVVCDEQAKEKFPGDGRHRSRPCATAKAAHRRICPAGAISYNRPQTKATGYYGRCRTR